MVYLTYHYNSTRFDTVEEARAAMENEVQKHHISYRKVYEHTYNGLTVVIYQYQTLYFEMFIIHEKLSMHEGV